MKKFVLEDYYDILNLHKALMEAKFHDNPQNEDIQGSPILARIMNEIVEILSEMEPNGSAKWIDWRKLRNHLQSTNNQGYGKTTWSNMVDRASKNKLWIKYSRDKKVSVTKDYFSPFVLEETEIENFINIIDAKLLK